MIEGMTITWGDVAVLVVIVLSAGIAVGRGFITEILSLASWGGGLMLALYGEEHLTPHVEVLIGYALISQLVTIVSLFIIATVLLTLAARAIGTTINQSSLGPVNRSLGLIFGLARGWVLLCLLYLACVWVFTQENLPLMIQSARLHEPLRQSSVLLVKLAPAPLQRKALDALGEIRDDLEAVESLRQNYERLTNPAPRPARPSEDGYSQQDRKALENLLEQDP